MYSSISLSTDIWVSWGRTRKEQIFENMIIFSNSYLCLALCVCFILLYLQTVVLFFTHIAGAPTPQGCLQVPQFQTHLPLTGCLWNPHPSSQEKQSDWSTWAMWPPSINYHGWSHVVQIRLSWANPLGCEINSKKEGWCEWPTHPKIHLLNYFCKDFIYLFTQWIFVKLPTCVIYSARNWGYTWANQTRSLSSESFTGMIHIVLKIIQINVKL